MEDKRELLEIKKSKFIAISYSVQNLQQVKEILANLKMEHKKATHICYAYKLSNPLCAKYCDDGEPSGTAGKPIFNVIDMRNKTDVLVCVIRYFGGIMLGAGGLCRAYGKSAGLVL